MVLAVISYLGHVKPLYADDDADDDDDDDNVCVAIRWGSLERERASNMSWVLHSEYRRQ